MFNNRGFCGSKRVLRPLSGITTNTLEEAERFFQLDEALTSHCEGTLRLEHVTGFQACSACRYIISKGKNGSKPHLESIKVSDVVKRCLGDCVFYAVHNDANGSPFIEANKDANRVASELRSKALTPFK